MQRNRANFWDYGKKIVAVARYVNKKIANLLLVPSPDVCLKLFIPQIVNLYIYFVRNYTEHAQELNNPVPKSPFVFLKPTTSYVRQPLPILLPRGANVHHESMNERSGHIYFEPINLIYIIYRHQLNWAS